MSAARGLTFVDVLAERAVRMPEATAFVFLQDGEAETRRLSYGELHNRALRIAVHLEEAGLRGERALLLYPPGLDILEGFLGCLYAGVIAVPAHPPDPARLARLAVRLQAIRADAGAKAVLTTAAMRDSAQSLLASAPDLAALHWIATDAVDPVGGGREPQFAPEPEGVAYLQYTSGSTGTPKGVVISHANLIYTLRDSVAAFEPIESPVTVSWLPSSHDFGLVFGSLLPIFSGYLSVLMPPEAFLRKPARWLRAITRFRGTYSAAPNFAYDLCTRKISEGERAGLDLSSWEFALNGAEPIRWATLQAFIEAFARCGFDARSVHPAYGLAEATLKVSCAPYRQFPRSCRLDGRALAKGRVEPAAAASATGQDHVLCGMTLLDTKVAIVDPDTLRPCGPDRVGEVWVGGPAVALGYWNQPEATEATFRARTAGDDGPFLRTGDIGFVHDGQLVVCGRRKDLIIIGGQNHYPQDIEMSVERAHAIVRPGCCAAFAMGNARGERVGILAEVDTRTGETLDLDAVLETIVAAVTAGHELPLDTVGLVPAGAIPKTSSGKIQRSASRDLLELGGPPLLARWQSERTGEPEHDGREQDGPGQDGPEQDSPVESQGEWSLRNWLVHWLARETELRVAAIDVHTPFARYGLGSIQAVRLAADLERRLGVTLSSTLVWRYPTIGSLARHLSHAEAASPAPGRRPGFSEPIAIIGAGCRFPGGIRNLDEFWRVLQGGIDAIREVPGNGSHAAGDDAAAGWGGFLDEVEMFDAEFFGIAPREARSMDPQQRLLLEVAWEAFENAGIPAHATLPQQAGVYVGICGNDYAARAMSVPQIDAHSATGNLASVAAGRIAYTLALSGPAISVDTACSSSLVAVHLACQAIRAGECDLALAGGVNLVLAPEGTLGLTRLGALSPTGRCRAFAAEADGYVRADGCGLILLAPLGAARAAGHRILAVIRGSAVNHDGHSNGLAAPSSLAQEEVIRAALEQARAAPADVGYVECHGTGTVLGDPIEVEALAAVYQDGRAPTDPVWIGSVKSNLGHAEGAAGVAGLIKAVLALRHDEIPPTLHFLSPNPHVRWAEIPVRVASERTPWLRGTKPRLAGVSSFGISGTNAHLILEEAPLDTGVPETPVLEKSVQEKPVPETHLLPLSGRTEAALFALAARHAAHLAVHPELTVAEIAFSLGAGRVHFEERAALVVAHRDAVEPDLRALATGTLPGSVLRGRAGGDRLRLGFLFTGQGAQYAGMARVLYETTPVFRAAIDRCAAVLDPLLGQPLVGILRTGAFSDIDDTTFAQPALFAVAWALAELWRSWGIVPDVVVGHSVGEIAAACVAGVFSLEEALRFVAARGRLMGALPPGGAMVSIGAGEALVLAALAPFSGRVTIAACNAPDECVISGPEEVVLRIAAAFGAEGVETRRLTVSHAFHSPLMRPALVELEAVARRLTFTPPRISFVSNVTGALVRDAVATAAWWVRHAELPVRFADGIRAAASLGIGAFVEIGPRPVLCALGVRCLPGSAAVWLPSLRQGRNDQATIQGTLGELYVRGAAIDWTGLAQPYPHRRVEFPTYPFQRQRHWIIEGSARQTVRPAEATGARAVLADDRYEVVWREHQRGPAVPAKTSGRWLVVGGGGGVGDALATALGAGAAVRSDELEAILARGEEVRGIVHYAAPDAAGDSGSDELPRVRLALENALEVVHAVARRAGVEALADPSPALWFVTTGGVSSCVTLAPLWGFGRVVAIEHPEFWGGMVDLDPQDPTNVTALAHELLAPDGEDQIAFHRGRRLVARLVRTHADPPKTAFVVKGAWLVTGGLGALGLHVARWLAAHGARSLVLASRRGLDTPGAQEAVDGLAAAGTTVRIVSADMRIRSEVARALAEADRLEPLEGVVHAAGVASPEPISRLTSDTLAGQGAKIAGAWHLHELTRQRMLRHFVLFSSIAGVCGAAGQAVYAAGNAFLDALARVRRSAGLPALSIAWGPWAGGGMASGDVLAMEARHGVGSLAPPTAIAVLEGLVGGAAPEVVVVPVDWTRFRDRHERMRPRPLLAELVGARNRQDRVGPERGEWATHLRTATAGQRRELLAGLVRTEVARSLGFQDAKQIEPRRGFFELGMDSLMAIELGKRLELVLGIPVRTVAAFRDPNAEALAEALLSELGLGSEPATRAAPPYQSTEPIAIIGIGCRLPGGVSDPDSFWRLLEAGEDAVRPIPGDRFDGDAFYDADPGTRGMSYVRDAALLDDVAQFDPAFFGISPREAVGMDPQQRILLEVAWHALEDAGQDPRRLGDRKAGVFIGISPGDYGTLAGLDADATGNMPSVAAGRLSFVLGLQGPSLAVDTACSSALVALHLAVQSLRDGECEVALAGGVNVIATPASFVALSRLRALAPDGRCKTFSAVADGYGRGEGCAIVILTRLSAATSNGDRILALIRGSAMNHDGAASGLTVPNGRSQEATIRLALANAGVAPADVSYLEAHGTGTALGDPIEVESAAAVYGEARSNNAPLLIGTVKTNIGHLEAAAGLAGLVKVVLALREERIPAHLHCATRNPRISWDVLPVLVATEPQPWPRGPTPRIAGVSAFGMSGTNVHVIVEEAPARPMEAPGELGEVPGTGDRPVWLLPLSAKTPGVLQDLAGRHAAHIIARPDLSLADLAHSAAVGRAHLEERAAVIASCRDDALADLRALARGARSATVARGRAPSDAPRVAFLFTGQGMQYAGMGRELYETSPVFRAAIDRCRTILDPVLTRPLLSVLFPDEGQASPIDETPFTQPALVALAWGLSELWRSWGIVPDAVLGHDVGEVVAACVSGVMSIEDALRLVAARASLLGALPPGEAMISMAADDARLRPMLAEFRAVALGIRFSPPTILLVSTVTGALAGDEVATAEYWLRHIETPVRFADGMRVLGAQHISVYLEIGPQPALCALGALSVPSTTAAWLPSLARDREGWSSLCRSLGELYVRGAPVDWKSFDAPCNRRRVPLPTYPFQRERYWVASKPRITTAVTAVANAETWPLAGAALDLPGATIHHVLRLDRHQTPALFEHVVFDRPVAPGAFHPAVVLAVAAERFGATSATIEEVQFLRALVLDDGALLHVTLEPVVGKAGAYRFAVATPGESRGDWRVHSEGLLRLAVPPPSLAATVASVRTSCETPVSTAELLAGLGAAQIRYGPRWNWVGEGRRGAGCGMVRLRPPAGGEFLAAPLHPALLDNAVGAIALLTAWSGTVDLTGTAVVPFAMGAFRWYRSPSGPVSCVGWAKGGPDKGGTWRCDFALIDDDDRIVAEIEDLVVKRAPMERFLAFSEATRVPPLHALHWPLTPAPPMTPKPLRWLLSGKAGVLGVLLADAVRAAGGNVEALSETAPSGRDLVFLWSPDDGDVLPFVEAEQASVALLAVIQSLVAAGRPARLVVVTVGAQAVEGIASSRFAPAALWGLARAARAEHPELGIRLVDLDPTLDPGEGIRALMLEMSAGEAPEVAWRGTSRRMPQLRTVTPSGPATAMKGDATYLVTGGFGGLGVRVARWLVDRGARHLLLLGRNGPDEIAGAAITGFEAEGVHVGMARVDVSNRAALAQVLEALPATAPLRGVVHAAGVVDDGLLSDETHERLARIFAPKVAGAFHLHELTRPLPLDFFVMFSSLAGLLGSAGQSSYAAANAVLDALAERRRTLGLPATSIAWGPWAESGMAARLHERGRRRGHIQLGLEALTTATALALLQRALDGNLAVVAAFALATGSRATHPLLAAIPTRLPGLSPPRVSVRLGDLDAAERTPRIAAIVCEEAAIVLGIRDPADVPADRPLSELGLDSLGALELRARLTAALDVPAPMTLLLSHPTPLAAAEFLHDEWIRAAVTAADVGTDAGLVESELVEEEL